MRGCGNPLREVDKALRAEVTVRINALVFDALVIALELFERHQREANRLDEATQLDAWRFRIAMRNAEVNQCASWVSDVRPLIENRRNEQ